MSNVISLLDVPKDVQQRTLVSGQLLDLLGDMPTQGNKLDDKLSAGDVEIINLMGDEMSSVDPAEISLCATRLWLHRLSFILIVMGSISLLFISIFYILAFMKHKKVSVYLMFLSFAFPYYDFLNCMCSPKRTQKLQKMVILRT